MSVGIGGTSSSIARAFKAIVPADEHVVSDRLIELPADLDRYFICTGYLAGKRVGELSATEMHDTWTRNFGSVARFCDRVLSTNPKARICVMGSESGFRGSYDMAYAGAKAALHLYVETKKLDHPGQQLVAIAPTVIWDTTMTQKRWDKLQLAARGGATRHQRWLEAREVAELAHHLLFAATPFLSNTIIRLKEHEG